MSSFNGVNSAMHNEFSNMVENSEGSKNVSFEDPKLRFYMAVATNLLEKQSYRDSASAMVEIEEHICRCGTNFSMKLAIYASQTMYLRTAPIVIMTLLAMRQPHNPLIKVAVSRVINRADQMAEMLACYQHLSSSSIKSAPRQMIKGIKHAFELFDKHQLTKYLGKRNDITLRDVMFVCHPKPRYFGGQMDLFRDIANNCAAPPVTWETTHSAVGQTNVGKSIEAKQESSRDTWDQLIGAGNMGYMATLRNVRNFLDANIGIQSVDYVCANLTDPKAILKSKQFPWRFYTAIREIEKGDLDWDPNKAQLIYTALINAALYSVRNMVSFSGSERTLSVADVSGSMQQPLSRKSTVMTSELAQFYGRMLSHANKYNKYIEFATEVNTDPDRNPFARDMNIIDPAMGNGTNAHLAIAHAINKRAFYDNIVIFTDNQFWETDKSGPLGDLSISTLFQRNIDHYRKVHNRNMKLYLIALCDYDKGAPVALTKNNFVVSGFTNETFKIIDGLNNSGEIVRNIDSIELRDRWQR